MPASVPKIPKSVKVGNLVYSIELNDDKVDGIAESIHKDPLATRGATLLHEQQIYLRGKGIYGSDIQRNVLAHEILHCMFEEVDVDGTEEFVDDMGKLLVRFLQDNPKLTAYLASTG